MCACSCPCCNHVHPPMRCETQHYRHPVHSTTALSIVHASLCCVATQIKVVKSQIISDLFRHPLRAKPPINPRSLHSKATTSPSCMRRRKGGPADNELQESLLGDLQQPSSAPVQPSQRHQQLIPYPGPFSVNSFIQWVVHSWLAFVSTLSSCLQGLLGGGGSTTLSLVQAQRLEELQDSLAVPYDAGNLQHQQQLQELWALAFPELPFSTLKHNQWKEMGWQSDDPARDFRGAGLYGLDNLIYMGTHHPALFKQMMLKSQGQRSEWEYPFAAGGLNLTFQIAEVLGVHNNPGQLPKTAAGRAFCELLRDSDVAFEEVYCITYALLDRVWLRRKASYMEFNSVMAEVKACLDKALRKRPKTLQQLRQHLQDS